VLERTKHWKYTPDGYEPPYVLPAQASAWK
jgi:hypothetical protein